MILRRKRYAIVVTSLLALVFVGVGVVVSLMTLTTFRPLPFASPETLVSFFLLRDGNADLWPADTLALTTRLVPELANVAGFATNQTDVRLGGFTKLATVVTTSPNYFALLRLRVDGAGATSTYGTASGSAIVSRQFAAAFGLATTDAPGKTLLLFDRPVTIVGVIDRIDAFPADGDLWVSESRGTSAGWLAVGRTRSPANIDELRNRLTLAVGQVFAGKARVGVYLKALSEAARPSMAAEQRGLSAGIVVFAIIAILNYALLGIGEARRRGQEFAIRVALGATRGQVARQFFLEQLRLIGAAALAATALFMIGRVALPASDLFVPSIRLVPRDIWLMIAVAFSVLLSAAALPSRIAAGTGEAETLRRVSARGSRLEQTWNRVFIGLQFAVTAFLLVAGGSAAVAYVRAQNTKYGFDPNDVVIGTINFQTPALQDDRQAKEAALEIARSVKQSMPGARTTVFGSTGLAMGYPLPAYAIEDPTRRIVGLAAYSSQEVLPEFFELLGLPILSGRPFREADDENAQPIVIVSELAAHRLWGTTNVVGKRLLFRPGGPQWMTVVGVAAEVQPLHGISLQFQARGIPWPLIYRPLKQTVPHSLAPPYFRFEGGRNVGYHTGVSILIRAGPHTNPANLRTILGKVAPGEKFASLGQLTSFMDRGGEVEHGRFTTKLLVAFAIAGFALAIFGAILLVDEVVRSRTNEIGIRRALGAQSASLVVLASRETFVAGMTGVIAGVFAGARLGVFAAAWLKGTFALRAKGADVSWLLAAGAAVILVVLLAAFTSWRAARAARLDPMVALRVS
jgi:hypothetical protein